MLRLLLKDQEALESVHRLQLKLRDKGVIDAPETMVLRKILEYMIQLTDPKYSDRRIMAVAELVVWLRSELGSAATLEVEVNDQERVHFKMVKNGHTIRIPGGSYERTPDRGFTMDVTSEVIKFDQRRVVHEHWTNVLRGLSGAKLSEEDGEIEGSEPV